MSILALIGLYCTQFPSMQTVYEDSGDTVTYFDNF